MNLKTTGIISCSSINEYLIEPDGSVWEHVFHHDNPSTYLFSSSDTFSTGVYKNEHAWFNFQVCKSLTSWEFLYVQIDTAGATPRKYRWIQTKSPFNAAYADVAPSAVTRITTSGYTDGGYGGFHLLNSNTYFAIANQTSGNWWGATGCWTNYNGGIPAYPTVLCTTGQVDAYVRIDNTNIGETLKLYKNDIIETNNLVEY